MANDEGWDLNDSPWDKLAFQVVQEISKALLSSPPLLDRDSVGIVVDFFLQPRFNTHCPLLDGDQREVHPDEDRPELLPPSSSSVVGRPRCKVDACQRLFGRYVLLRLMNRSEDPPFDVFNACTGLQFQTLEPVGFPFEAPDPQAFGGCGECQLLAFVEEGRRTLVHSASTQYWTEHTCNAAISMCGAHCSPSTPDDPPGSKLKPLHSSADLFRCENYTCVATPWPWPWSKSHGVKLHFFSVDGSQQLGAHILPRVKGGDSVDFGVLGMNAVNDRLFVALTCGLYVVSSTLRPSRLLHLSL